MVCQTVTLPYIIMRIISVCVSVLWFTSIFTHTVSIQMKQVLFLFCSRRNKAVRWFIRLYIAAKWESWGSVTDYGQLSSGRIFFVPINFFGCNPVHFRNLSNNRITILEAGCFDNLSSSLLVVKLNRNRISMIPPKIFKLPHLQFLWVIK